MDIFPIMYIGPGLFDKARLCGFSMVDLASPGIIEILSDLTITQAEGVFLSDLASRPKLGKTLLLKFLEEFKGKIVLYSSVDVVDKVLLSRFMTVEKLIESDPSDKLIILLRKHPALLRVVLNKSKFKRKVLDLWSQDE